MSGADGRRSPWERSRALAAFTWLYVLWSLVPVAIAVAFSFRQTIFAFPGGGGAYVVTRDNLGPVAGLTAMVGTAPAVP